MIDAHDCYPQLIEDVLHPILYKFGLKRPQDVYPELARRNIKNPDYVYGGDTMIEMKFITVELWHNDKVLAFLNKYATDRGHHFGQCKVSFEEMTDAEKIQYFQLYYTRLRSYLRKARLQTATFKKEYPNYTKSVLLLINTGCRGIPLDQASEWLNTINKSESKPYLDGYWFINYKLNASANCIVTGHYEGAAITPALREALASLNEVVSESVLGLGEEKMNTPKVYIPTDFMPIASINGIEFFWVPTPDANLNLYLGID